MKKATLQTVARDVRAIARSLPPLLKPGSHPTLKAVPLSKFETEIGITIFENQPMRLVLVESIKGQEPVSDVKPATWQELTAYATKNNASLPTRIDALVLFARANDKFKTDLPYWTSEESAGTSTYAWCQWFHNGHQFRWDKDSKYRACLVRRLPI